MRDSANLLRDSVGRYLFTSTGSVYDFDQDELPEDARLLEVTDPDSEDVGRYYGPLKVMCEEAVQEIFGDRGTIARLHVVAGPGDPTDRFTYWPVRIHHGDEVIAPGDMDNPVQFIDVRDLAEFNMHLLEQDTGGIFNVAGPTLDETRMDEFLYGIRAVTTSRVSFTWVDEDFLANREPPARYPPLVLAERPRESAGARPVAPGCRGRPQVPPARGHGARDARLVPGRTRGAPPATPVEPRARRRDPRSVEAPRRGGFMTGAPGSGQPASVDQSDRIVPINLRQSGRTPVEMLISTRVRKSPYWHLSHLAGCWRATVYNRIYHPAATHGPRTGARRRNTRRSPTASRCGTSPWSGRSASGDRTPRRSPTM